MFFSLSPLYLVDFASFLEEFPHIVSKNLNFLQWVGQEPPAPESSKSTLSTMVITSYMGLHDKINSVVSHTSHISNSSLQLARTLSDNGDTQNNFISHTGRGCHLSRTNLLRICVLDLKEVVKLHHTSESARGPKTLQLFLIWKIWGPRIYISNKFLGETDAGSQDT